MRKKTKQNMNGGTPMNTRPVAIIKNLPPHLAQRLAERQAQRLQRQTEAAIEQVKRGDVSPAPTKRGEGASTTSVALALPEPGTCCVCLGALKPNIIRLKGGDVVEAYCPTQVTRMGSLLMRHADEDCSPGGALYQANLPRLRAFAAIAQAQIDQDLPCPTPADPA